MLTPSEIGELIKPHIESSNFLLLATMETKVLAMLQKRNKQCVTIDFLVFLGILSPKDTTPGPGAKPHRGRHSFLNYPNSY